MKGLLSGVAAVAVAPSLPKPVAAGGTITGRWASSGPNWQELTRSQVKSIMFARNYGAPAPLINKQHDLSLAEADFQAIERRVMANFKAGYDPYSKMVMT